MKILVTGGAGYIGSHACIEFIDAGHDIVVLDNLCNASIEALHRVRSITDTTFPFHQIDLLDRDQLDKVFAEHSFDAVIHFAGLKAVGESVAKPLTYYRNNVEGSINLLETMVKYEVFNLVFSSSATVYGDPATVPITEDFQLHTTNPYGQSKLMIENIVRDCFVADPRWNVALLRYFNPVGAHSSGTIGEDPRGIPNNLMPYIAQVAVGKLTELSVFGQDYPTADGTGVRDYIHVVDLVKGHVKALDKLLTAPGVVTYNLGTGQGYSVLDMIKAFEAANDITIPYKIIERRPGDIAACYADPTRANKALGWSAEKSLLDMMKDTWRWQKQNPEGY